MRSTQEDTAGGRHPDLSVIIPTLDEARTIEPLLESLRSQQGLRPEVVVADGGSGDGTVELARSRSCRVVLSPPGRGRQMNRGAAVASAPLLLFLHADTGLPDGRLLRTALDAFREAVRAAGHDRIAGHFRIRFDGYTRRPFAFRYMEEKSALNRPETINGDQGLLLTRRFFDELGGFDESLPILEDQKMAARIRQRGAWILLPGLIRTSARRFETEGFERRHLMMAVMMGLHHVGLRAFFLEAPGVYRAQSRAGRLPVYALLSLVREVMGRMPLRRRLETWLKIGRYVKRNAWQLFFCLDVRSRRARPVFEEAPPRNRWLGFYDRLLEPILRPRVFDALTAALTWAWVMVLLRAWYGFRDRLPEEGLSPR